MPPKVVVAMSGGVDSSVAAALLKEQGYEVIGITLKTRDWNDEEGRKFGGCCGSSDFYDARSVAQTLDIPHYNFDYVEQFKVSVIGYFKESYLAAETPNPCIACNQFVKFDRLLSQAQALGADFLATGHYARIEQHPSPLAGEGGRRPDEGNSARLHPSPQPSPARGEGAYQYILKKAVDAAKDQSYVLYHLRQEQLAKLKFPVGEFTKPQIREIARKYGLVTADKPDSQEICFVPNNDYRAFLAEQVPAEARRPGVIRNTRGNVLGEHQGLPYYTVGQRSGLGLAVGKPLYVVALEKDSNTLVVGDRDEILDRRMVVRQVSWVAGRPPVLPDRAAVKIRYKHQEAAATLTDGETERQRDAPSPRPPARTARERAVRAALPPGGCQGVTPSSVIVQFDEAQSAITPGQAAVFYDGDTVLGGGVIDHAVR
jgi:tRNA-uridine 2-sulfurtransferase